MLINPYGTGIREQLFNNQICSTMDKCFVSFCDDKMANYHIVYTKKEMLKKFVDSKILIVGAGPSTNSVNFDPFDYDSIWSMNHFYKSDIMKNIKLDLVSIGPENNLHDPELISYLTRFRPFVGFEMRERWKRPYEAFYVNKFSKQNNCFAYETRFLGKTGVGARLTILASYLGASEIHILGFDGPQYQSKGEHSFEPGKTNLPAGCTIDNIDKAVRIHKEHYDYLWSFLRKQFPNTEYKNIGFESLYHELIKGDNHDNI